MHHFLKPCCVFYSHVKSYLAVVILFLIILKIIVVHNQACKGFCVHARNMLKREICILCCVSWKSNLCKIIEHVLTIGWVHWCVGLVLGPHHNSITDFKPGSYSFSFISWLMVLCLDLLAVCTTKSYGAEVFPMAP